MNKLLTRYWFYAEYGLGVGVTAYSVEDAVALMKSEAKAMLSKPNFSVFTKNINVQDLNQKHVVPNMGICSNRGVWFPKLD